MIKKTISYLAVVLLGISSLAAQDGPDSKAKEYLEILSEKSNSIKTFEIEFESKIVNAAEGIHIVQQGNIKVKGNKYNLKLDDNQIIVDGKAMYTISDCEAVIHDMPEENVLNPSNLFVIDNADFQYKMVKETTLDGKDVAIIELFPKDPKNAQFISITLTIDKNKMEPYIIKVNGREGNVYDYKIKKFIPNSSFPDTLLKFERSDFPCVEEVTDLREG